MDFTLKEYRRLIRALKETGYESLSFADYLQRKRPERFVILRHDVDLKPGNSLAVARLEKELILQNAKNAVKYFSPVNPGMTDYDKVIDHHRRTAADH